MSCKPNPDRPAAGQEPETPSRQALVAWLAGPPRRLPSDLAAACGLGLSMVYHLLNRIRRPSDRTAALIEIATKGEVKASGWFTADEAEARAKIDQRAAEAAPLLQAGERFSAAA